MSPARFWVPAALALTALAGCLPTRPEPRKDPLVARASGTRTGQVLAAKRVALEMAVLTRPVKDPIINEALWGVVDEQSVAPEARRVLEANGLRVARLQGGLPAEIEALFNAPPPHKIEPVQVNVASGDGMPFILGTAVPKLTLMLNRGDRTVGKDYDDASGFLHMTASHDGLTGVSLRIVPELHHGPVLRRFPTDAAANPYSVNNFLIKDGQAEEMFRELAATLTLTPGQIAIVGCHPGREGSLGAFLFTEVESNSDRLMQKVLFIRAARAGSPDGLITPVHDGAASRRTDAAKAKPKA